MCQRISAEWVVNNAQTNARALFPNADEITILRISLFSVVSARMVIPMYKGGLNPDWEIYNDAAKILEESIARFIAPNLADIEKAKYDKDIIDKFKDVEMTEFKPISRVDLLKACHEFIKNFESLEEEKDVTESITAHYGNLKTLLK